MKYLIWGVIAAMAIYIAMASRPQLAKAAPIKGVLMHQYSIGRTTIYEWRTNHNRLCTMVVDRIQSNAPFISCN